MHRGLAVNALTAVLLAGCGTGAPGAHVPKLPTAAVTPAAGPVAVGDDEVELLPDGGAAIERIVALVAGARQRMAAEIYEFDREELTVAMLDARRRGVAVTVIADPTVSTNAPTLARLRGAGAEVLLFPDARGQIDHVKLLLVDGAVGVFGGMNWGGRSYLNHDFDVAVRGPVVARLEAIFAADLVRSGNVGQPSTSPPPSGAGVRIATTYPEAAIRPLVLEALGAARRYVFVEMYVITDGPVLAALEQAAGRGIETFVLLDPDQQLNQQAALRLGAAGVSVRFYRSSGEKLHAKAMVTDGRALVVGSANWTSSGFGHNHELDAAIESAAIAAQALLRMEADWQASG